MADTKISDLAAVTSLIGTDEFVLARSGDTKKVTAVDLATALAGGGELAYAQITSAFSTAVTTEASAATIVTAGSVTVDGSTTIVVEFYAPYLIPQPTINAQMLINLWEATAGNLGRLGFWQTPAAAGFSTPVFVSRQLTPSAGTYTYSIRGWVSTGTGAVGAGAGGSAAYMPAYIRVTTA